LLYRMTVQAKAPQPVGEQGNAVPIASCYSRQASVRCLMTPLPLASTTESTKGGHEPMRAQGVNTTLAERLRAEEALAQYQQDRDGLAARYGLTEEERERLKAKRMGWLYVQGVHPYILAQFGLSIRYDMRTYAKQVRGATGYGSAAQ